jgi:hypothetical protein
LSARARKWAYRLHVEADALRRDAVSQTRSGRHSGDPTSALINAVTASHSASTINPDGVRIGRDVPLWDIERRLGDGYGGAADHTRRAAAERPIPR